MSKRTTITLPTVGSSRGRVDVSGLNEFARDFKRLPKEIQKDIRKAAKGSVGEVVREAARLASKGERQQRAMARAIRADFFRGAPAIIGGGSKQVSLRRGKDGKTHRVPAGQLFVGAEFGAKNMKQFPRRSPRMGRGNEGYFFYPAIRKALEDKGTIIKNFVAQIDTALKRII